jgi:hypothetical protein
MDLEKWKNGFGKMEKWIWKNEIVFSAKNPKRFFHKFYLNETLVNFH